MIDPHEDTRHRTDDHSTSMEGAYAVSRRAPNQRMRLLHVFDGRSGLTDEEAAELAGLAGSCYWKRCGELRRDGLIEYTEVTRKGNAGVGRKVSRITYDGIVALMKERTSGS